MVTTTFASHGLRSTVNTTFVNQQVDGRCSRHYGPKSGVYRILKVCGYTLFTILPEFGGERYIQLPPIRFNSLAVHGGQRRVSPEWYWLERFQETHVIDRRKVPPCPRPLTLWNLYTHCRIVSLRRQYIHTPAHTAITSLWSVLLDTSFVRSIMISSSGC